MIVQSNPTQALTFTHKYTGREGTSNVCPHRLSPSPAVRARGRETIWGFGRRKAPPKPPPVRPVWPNLVGCSSYLG